jgi:hypothetical protein
MVYPVITEVKISEFTEVPSENSQKVSENGRDFVKLDDKTSKSSKLKNVLLKILSLTLHLIFYPIYCATAVTIMALDLIGLKKSAGKLQDKWYDASESFDNFREKYFDRSTFIC